MKKVLRSVKTVFQKRIPPSLLSRISACTNKFTSSSSSLLLCHARANQPYSPDVGEEEKEKKWKKWHKSRKRRRPFSTPCMHGTSFRIFLLPPLDLNVFGRRVWTMSKNGERKSHHLFMNYGGHFNFTKEKPSFSLSGEQ